eukprot:CAMPEP_0197654326 /NCGR_PEP_ID=MMETSP1338-20131121/38787_1 /TAXON_ID=43686 ORGANISM="Pelagodinium beii, Strain RCC1491" /NCGR_SAMPLE_ID=MMETSP1338 /ASSEMBLY_ACC=CAM_ASM_000754 /LENGTH=185 /DNA_ID=CAMNT_0043229757 /DNA_START=53 /DNA_END=610 /DNA_ORIENTATION=+
MASATERRGRSVLVLVLLAVAGLSAFLGCKEPVEPLAFVSGSPVLRGRQVSVSRESEKVDAIVEELKGLTLLEASELVKAIEDTFGVDASASAGAVMMAGPAGGGGVEEEEKAPEKTEFDLILKEVPKDKKIAILKVVRGITGMGLKDAKGIVDNPGKFIEAKPKDYCEDAKKQLEEAGAVVELE